MHWGRVLGRNCSIVCDLRAALIDVDKDSQRELFATQVAATFLREETKSWRCETYVQVVEGQ